MAMTVAPTTKRRLALGGLGQPGWRFALLSLILPRPRVASGIDFNYEVEKRIVDRIENYMRQSVDTNLLLSNYRFSGGFPSGSLIASDREAYLMLTHSLATTPLIYYGLEDGTCTGFYKDSSISTAYFREPGDSGYRLDDETMAKHRRTCVDPQNGDAKDCIMNPGSPYVKSCKAGGDDGAEDGDNIILDGGGKCSLVPCPDANSQADCSLLEGIEERERCKKKIKYCRPYTIEYSPEGGESESEAEAGEEEEPELLGYIPSTDFCHDVRGKITQEVGAVVKGYTPSTYDLATVIDPANDNDEEKSSSVHSLGSCFYGDGETLVNRTLTGSYAYCGGNGKVCNDTFAGGYQVWDYDPRLRPWYIDTKILQRPAWTDPYPFFEDSDVGITATHPIYDIMDGKNVFAGVLAVDYRFKDITDFLVTSYGSTSTAIAIYEDTEPHYVIATSTGTPATNCPPDEKPETDVNGVPSCDPVRVRMPELSVSGNNNNPKTDRVLVKAFERHKEAGYPKELLSVRGTVDDRGDDDSSSNDALFLSQGVVYEQPGANLRWRIIVLSPAENSSSDSIDFGHPLFGPLIAIGTLGVLVCSVLFITFFNKRAERAVIYADWRFTCTFILGCGLFNCSTFTLLGPNTDGLCMLRMWSFHLLFVVAFAPLFIKVWRMKQLVGGASGLRRKTISNVQTVLYMLPMIASQVVILTAISIADPPRQREVNEYSEGIVMQRIVCGTNTNALLIVELLFEAGLILVGCVLAFQTRHLDKRFGESKQLIFAMYNLALVGVTFLIVNFISSIEPTGQKLLHAIGVFWGTVFSSSAFVVPRLLQVRKRRSSTSGTAAASNNGRVGVSGLSNNPQPSILRSKADKKPSSTSSVHWSLEEEDVSVRGGVGSRIESLSRASECENMGNELSSSDCEIIDEESLGSRD